MVLFVEPDAEKDPLEHQAWERCNDLIISWILFNLELKVAKSVLHIRSGRSMWVDLGDRFGYASLTLIYELEQKLANLSQGPMTVIDFFTAIKTVWDELNDADPTPTCTCNKCLCDLSKRVLDRELRQRMLRFMMKLNEQFNAIRSNILMMSPLPNINQIYRIFTQEENHKEVSKQQESSVSSENMAMLADKRGFSKPSNVYVRPGSGVNGARSFSGNGVGGTKNFSGNKRPNSMFFCTHCNIPGHSYDRCFKVHGYPPGFKPYKDRRVAAVSHVQPYENSIQDGVDESQVSVSDSSGVPFTTAQYSYLISLIQNKGAVSESQADLEGSGQAMLAGPCSEKASLSSW